MTQEQRRHERLDSHIRAVVQPTAQPKEGEPPAPEVACFLTDVSEGGLCLLMEDPFPVDTELNIHLVIDRAMGDSQYFTAIGEVKRVVPDQDGDAEVGIKFTYVPDDSANVLKDHFLRRRPRSM